MKRARVIDMVIMAMDIIMNIMVITITHTNVIHAIAMMQTA